jgi:hypothetical protein
MITLNQQTISPSAAAAIGTVAAASRIHMLLIDDDDEFRESLSLNLAGAALIDPAFKARLAEIHRRLEARRATDIPRRMLAPLAPFFRDLERDAEAVLSGWKAP